jgi:hypothetical protein
MKITNKLGLIIPLCSGAIAAFWLIYGLSNYGFWDTEEGPVVAFVPSLIAAVLLLVSVAGFIRAFKEKSDAYRLESWSIVLAAFGTFGLIFLAGMIPALLIFVFVWVRFYEKESWKNTIIILILSFAIAYGVFVMWLAVPFPIGVAGNVIFY